jgi:hypothetical protein
VKLLAESLVQWQWQDGGWNCDKRPEAHHSSFHESLIPLWGLTEYHKATGDETCRLTIHRAAELFLRHRLFRSESSGSVIHPEMTELHYPPYWHYDILQALLVFSRLGALEDPRLVEALDILEAKRRSDGLWRASRHYWKPSTIDQLYHDPVDWGRKGPNLMLTLNALRVLKAAGRSL